MPACFQLNSEDTSFIEAVEQFLEGWASLLEHSSQFPAELFNESATRILNCYVQCHLAAPDGLRGTFSPQVNNGIHLDEICDLDSDDRELFADQLCTIGSFGRIIPGHALNLLTKLLESRACQFEKYLSAVKNSAGTSVCPVKPNMSDIHIAVIVKKSSRKNLSADRLPTGYQQATDSYGNRQATNSFSKKKICCENMQ